MRRAWKVFVAGWMRPRAGPVAATTASLSCAVVCGACRLRLRAIGELVVVEAGDELGGGLAPRAIHAHVEGRVLLEREAALALVELERRHAEVGEDGVDLVEAL
jgi:uncharacterized protein (DUF1786 family)